MKKPAPKRSLLPSIMIFLYVVIGYLTIVYFLDPDTFITDLPNQWWIIPFALFPAVVRYIIVEIPRARKPDHE